MNYKIYKITNLKTLKSYVGFTRNNINRRFSGHRKDSTRTNTKFATALREYPNRDDWKIELIEENIPQNEIIEKESNYIKLYDTYNNGYNSNKGNTGNVKGNFKHTEEFKKCASERNKRLGIRPSALCIENSIKCHTGKKLTEEHKNKICKWSKKYGTPILLARIEEHRKEMIGHEFNAEEWKLTFANENVIVIKNLKKWCRENAKYKACGFYTLSKGKAKKYKDCIKAEKVTNKYGSKKEI